MPRRIKAQRVDSSEVQGEDSWVAITPLKVGEIRAIRQAKKRGDEEFDPVEEILCLVGDHVVGWNWRGDEDEILPSPKEDPTVIDQLTTAEVLFLSNHLTGGVTEEESKN